MIDITTINKICKKSTYFTQNASKKVNKNLSGFFDILCRAVSMQKLRNNIAILYFKRNGDLINILKISIHEQFLKLSSELLFDIFDVEQF